MAIASSITAALIAGAASGGSAIAGNKMASNANRRATDANTRANDQAMALERDNEARRRQEYDQQQREMRTQWDAEQRRREPYRRMSDLILQQRAQRMGVPAQTFTRPTEMPQGWQPNQPRRTMSDLVRPGSY
jgi:hypothetical protein